MRRRIRRRPRRIFAAIPLTVAALLGSIALAPPALADTELVVEVGFGGYVQSGRPYPVHITVSSDQLVSGTLRITSTTGVSQTVQEIPIDAAGGSVKEYTIVAQSLIWEPGQVQVELVDGDDVLKRARGAARDPQQNDLVGVFPGVVRGELAERADTAIGDAVALLFPLEADDLAVGWGALGPLDSVVITGDELRDLSDNGADQLLTWVARGGQLIVDEAIGTALPALPDEWVPGATGRSQAGQGEIILSDGAAAAGAWDEVLLPSPVRSINEADAYGQYGGYYGGGSLVSELGNDAGFDVPGVWWLIAILAIYILIAGPLLWFALRRTNRQFLAWVIVPVTAVLFTGVVTVLGSGLRNSTKDAHATVIEVQPRGSVATSAFMLSSRSGGEVSLELPEQWQATTAVSDDYGGFGQTTVQVRGNRLSADLDAGGFAVLRATGPASEYDNALVVEATSSASGMVTGTITNTLDIPLYQVGVFADLAGTNLGTIPAGATVEFEVNGPGVNPNFGEPSEYRVWRDSLSPQLTGQFGPPVAPAAGASADDGAADEQHLDTVNFGLWTEMSATWGLSGRVIGDVVVGGWTDELPAISDPSITTGRTLIVARTTTTAAGDTASDITGRRYLVRGPSGVPDGFPRGDNNEYIVGGQLRLVLPTHANGTPLDTADLVLTLPINQKRVELWVDGEWRELDIEPKRAAVVALPEGAAVHGSVFLRTYLNFNSQVNFRQLGVRSATERDDVLPATYRSPGDETADGVAVTEAPADEPAPLEQVGG